MRIKSKLFQWWLKDKNIIEKDKNIIEQVERDKWLFDNQVPDHLRDRVVSASDDFLVLRVVGDAKLYRIYTRDANGEIDPFFQFKEFYAMNTFIRSPKDFPPEKIEEKWEEWHYPNEFYRLKNKT